MLTASSTDGPAFHTRSHTQNTSSTTSTPHPDTTPQISSGTHYYPKTTHSRMLGHLTTKCRRLTHSASTFPEKLLNGKAPHHEFDTFTHIKGLLYKHITDAGKKFGHS